jgi:hypothetical protein
MSTLIIPAEALVEYDDYDEETLTDYVKVSEVLTRALGTDWSGTTQRVTVLDALAEQLGRLPGRLRNASYRVLWALFLAIEENVAREGAGDTYTDAESSRGRRIAENAVNDLGIDLIVAAMSQLAWGNTPPDAAKRVADVPAAVRSTLVKRLAPQITRLLERWRKKRAWVR